MGPLGLRSSRSQESGHGGDWTGAIWNSSSPEAPAGPFLKDSLPERRLKSRKLEKPKENLKKLKNLKNLKSLSLRFSRSQESGHGNPGDWVEESSDCWPWRRNPQTASQLALAETGLGHLDFRLEEP